MNPAHGPIIEPTTAPRPQPRWSIALAGALCVAASLLGSALFLPHQSLWNDEASQMSGLSLDPAGQVRWLAGWEKHDFGLAEDRMPPLSYWVGWLWSRAFGLNEASMRWMGATLVGLATLIIFETARRAWGAPSGVAAALIFALSPNVIVAAVEIRAYPLFLFTSSATFYCLSRYLDDSSALSRKWLVAMSMCSILTIYTHFFGLVLAGGVFLSALLVGRFRAGKTGPVLIAAGCVGLATGGIAPFVLASFGRSSAAVPALAEENRISALARLFYRLFAHASMSVTPIVIALAALGIVAAALAAIAPKQKSTAVALGLFLAWTAGAIVVAAAQIMLKHFQAATPHYNLWMLPPLVLLLGSGLGAASKTARTLAAAGAALLIASYAYGDLQLAVHGDFFAHTPHRAIDTLIQRLGPDRVSLILDVNDHSAWDVYAPVHFKYADIVPQYVFTDRTAGQTKVADYPDRKTDYDPAALPTEYLLVVHSVNERSAEIVDQIRQGVKPLPDGPIAKLLKADPRWNLVEESTHVAFVSAKIALFKRNDVK